MALENGRQRKVLIENVEKRQASIAAPFVAASGADGAAAVA